MRTAVVNASAAELQKSMRASDHTPLPDAVLAKAKAYEIAASLVSGAPGLGQLDHMNLGSIKTEVKRNLYAIALDLSAKAKKVLADKGRR